MKAYRYILFAVALLFAACGTQQKYAYLGDAPRDKEMPIVETYSANIYPGDRLYINVYSQVKESVVPFNEETKMSIKGETPEIKGYLVAEDGYIVFPVLGRVSTEGKTLESFARELEARLKEGNYVKDPIVTVTLMNFRVTVIGEVKYPRLLHVNGNRITIFEAIAQCGDITMDGMRDAVTVARFSNNEYIADTVDLTSATILNSPYYYLRQNDIVYVEQTDKKKRMATRDENWPHYVSSGVSAIRLAYQIVRTISRTSRYSNK
jgi:polysaccharide export outer membrane protein